MSDTAQLIGIMGEVDRAVAADPKWRLEVARVLPVYASRDAVWYDEFLEWSHERGLLEGEFPPLERALEMLGTDERQSPRPRALARRALAIALAARAFPGRFDEGGDLEQPALRALTFQGLLEDVSPERMLAHLRDGPPPIDGLSEDALEQWWDGVRRLVRIDIGPRPCTGRLVKVPGVDGAVATLKAGFASDEILFADAISFLDPSHWPGCCDFWCSMDKLADLPAGARYNETVSTDCGPPPFGWTISAELDFEFQKVGDKLAVTRYRLAPGRPKDGDDVLVDRGSLLVWDVGDGGPGIFVMTTKRVRFSRSFSGEALALMMCALGYAEVVEELVFNCAAAGGSGGTFPADDPLQAPKKGTKPGGHTIVDDLIDKGADAVKDCVDEYANVAKSSYEKIKTGTYGGDAAAHDAARLYVRMLRDGAAAVEAGIRATQTVRPAPPPET
jgi:hypothetical protein